MRGPDIGTDEAYLQDGLNDKWISLAMKDRWKQVMENSVATVGSE